MQKTPQYSFEIAKFIYECSESEKFYTRKINSMNDSIIFYGRDYHSFIITLKEINDTIKIKLKYDGYHGFKSNPPYKKFIQNLSDSLKIKFKASQFIITNVSNERR